MHEVTHAVLTLLVYIAAGITVPCVGLFLLELSEPTMGSRANEGLAMLWDLLLLSQFGVLHLFLATERWRRWVAHVLSCQMISSVHTLCSCVSIACIILMWSPLPRIIWRLDELSLMISMHVLFGMGVVLVFISSVSLTHIETLELQRLHFRERSVISPSSVARQSRMFGLALMLWATADMTTGRLLWAVVMSLYMAVGTAFLGRGVGAVQGEAFTEQPMSS